MCGVTETVGKELTETSDKGDLSLVIQQCRLAEHEDHGNLFQEMFIQGLLAENLHGQGTPRTLFGGGPHRA